jgi:hypothetical protein
MIEKTNALKPRFERPGDPNLGLGSIRNIRRHRWTHWFAECKELSGDVFVAGGFNQTGDPIDMILFTADVPVILRASSRYADAQIDVVGGGGGNVTIPWLHYYEAINLVGDPGLAIFASCLPATGGDYGEQIQAVTTTNGVTVVGYGAQVTLVDRSLQDDQPADITPSLHILCIAKGAVIDGPGACADDQSYEGNGTTGGPAGAAFPDRNAILLLEDHYTQAMADAGNVYTDANGVIADIVGLFNIPAAA